MNYDEVAERVVDDFIASGSMHIKDGFVPLIRDALRRAANEAAWDGYGQGQDGAYEESPRKATSIVDAMVSKYGPPPEGGTR
jgi:hypothetical protein